MKKLFEQTDRTGDTDVVYIVSEEEYQEKLANKNSLRLVERVFDTHSYIQSFDGWNERCGHDFSCTGLVHTTEYPKSCVSYGSSYKYRRECYTTRDRITQNDIPKIEGWWAS